MYMCVYIDTYIYIYIYIYIWLHRSTRNNHEFVQSIRAHPTIKTRVGALLSLTQAGMYITV